VARTTGVSRRATWLSERFDEPRATEGIDRELEVSKVKGIWIVVLVLLSLAPMKALAQKTNVDWDHAVTDFSKYKTYQWVKPLRPTQNPLMDERIVAAVDAQLADKGLRKVESGGDLLVTYNAGMKQERSAMTSGMGGWRMGGGMGRIDPVIENIGTLVLDLSDGQQKKLIWRGVASDTLSDKSEKNTKTLNKAIEKLFKQYPPKRK
jgi:hypothetical protein